MWWYRDRKDKTDEAAGAGSESSAGPLVLAVREALAGRAEDPDAYLAMSLLVDSRIELADGACVDGHAWGDAEQVLQEALSDGGPLRLYNRFAREFGDGYSARDDLPGDHRRTLDELRVRLDADPGIAAISPRSGD